MAKACLLIHGLTGSPPTVSVVKDALLAEGFRVSAPYLAGHGRSVAELAKSTWWQWYETVRIAYLELMRDCDGVFCVGLSLGALLSLKLALDEGWAIKALALVGTPLRLAWHERAAIKAVRHTPLKAIIKGVPKKLEKAIADPVARKLYEQISLPSVPASSAFEIADLQKILIHELGRIKNPLLLLHGSHDRIAPISNVELVKNLVGSEIVETAIFKNSMHVITMDYEKAQVANTIVDFFKRFL